MKYVKNVVKTLGKFILISAAAAAAICIYLHLRSPETMPLWKPLCPPVEVLREAMKGYIYWLREFAAVTGVRHVDFARAFEEAQKAHPEEELFQEDGLHPTAAGCRLMADTVRATQSLKNLL